MYIYYKIIANAVLVIFVVMSQACHSSSENRSARGNSEEMHPQDAFEKYITRPIPTTTRAFDSRVTPITPTEYSIWIAFDCSEQDWCALETALSIRKSPSCSLKFATAKTPNDTGFEGYIDDDFVTYSDAQHRKYFVRKIKTGYRVVFFWRQN
jgi:hypothetical protein